MKRTALGMMALLLVALGLAGCADVLGIGDPILSDGGSDGGSDSSLCTAGTSGCSGAQPQTCDPTGHWQDTGSACGATQTCVSGACQDGCTPGKTQCSGNGVQTCSSSGQWGTAATCPTGEICQAGSCVCPSGETACAGACVNESTDPNNCGACGKKCSAACVGGQCRIATAIAAGNEYSCALLSGGTVKCWGSNSLGQLGNGNTTITTTTTPVSVTGLTGATAIAASSDHICALLSGGTVECWGSNQYGDLGAGGSPYVSATPVAVTGLTGATAVAAGLYHGCALLSGGTIDCWGWNTNGQLGNGTTSTGANTTPVGVIGLTGATAVAAGWLHSCAVLSNGTVECWGNNTNGQLGNGTTTQSTTPVVVTGLPFATAVVAGVDHSCAVVSSGTVECWGNNTNGQLGNGTTTASTTPVAVSW